MQGQEQLKVPLRGPSVTKSDGRELTLQELTLQKEQLWEQMCSLKGLVQVLVPWKVPSAEAIGGKVHHWLMVLWWELPCCQKDLVQVLVQEPFGAGVSLREHLRQLEQLWELPCFLKVRVLVRARVPCSFATKIGEMERFQLMEQSWELRLT